MTIKIWFVILCYSFYAFCVLNFASDCQFCKLFVGISTVFCLRLCKLLHPHVNPSDKATSRLRPNSSRTNFYPWQGRNFIRVILKLFSCLTFRLLSLLHIFSMISGTRQITLISPQFTVVSLLTKIMSCTRVSEAVLVKYL